MAKSSLQTALKASDSIVRKYVVELEKRNAKLQSQIVKLEADKVEAKNRVKALEEQWKMKKVDIQYNLPSEFGERLRRARDRTAGHAPQLTEEQLKAQILEAIPAVISSLEDRGYRVIPPPATA